MLEKTIKVIKIIDNYDLVINIGADEGAKVGDTYEIYTPGHEVFDPDTKDSLGTLDLIKASIKVKNVFPKMSICTSNHISTKKIPDLINSFSRTYDERMPLNVDSLDISGGFEDFDSKIKVGDFVRKQL